MSDTTDDSTRHVLDSIDGALAWEGPWQSDAMRWSPAELATADERREQSEPDEALWSGADRRQCREDAEQILRAYEPDDGDVIDHGSTRPHMHDAVAAMREQGWAAWHRPPRESLAAQIDEWPGEYEGMSLNEPGVTADQGSSAAPLDGPRWRTLGYLDPDSIRFSDFREGMDTVTTALGERFTGMVREFSVQFRVVGDQARAVVESIMPVRRHVPGALPAEPEATRPQRAGAGHTGPAMAAFRHHGTKGVYPCRTRRATRGNRRTHARRRNH